MNYINGFCTTNLDGYDCSRVTKFFAIPNIGDSVEVLRKGTRCTLKVVHITHGFNNLFDGAYVIIELHN